MGSNCCKSQIVHCSQMYIIQVRGSKEIKIFQSVFDDLSKTSPKGNSIDKETLCRFLGNSVLFIQEEMGSLVFSYFDKGGRGELYFEWFFRGFDQFVFRSNKDRIATIFKIFDVENKSQLDYSKLEILVSVCWSTFKRSSVFSGKLFSEFNLISNMSVEQRKKHFIITHLIDKYGDHDFLTLEDLYELFNDFPGILLTFANVFKEELWTTKETSNSLVLHKDSQDFYQYSAVLQSNVALFWQSGVPAKAICLDFYSAKASRRNLELHFTHLVSKKVHFVQLKSENDFDKWLACLDLIED